MKNIKFILAALFLTAAISTVFTSKAQAQNKQTVITPTSAGGIATYSLASLQGEAPTLVMLYDSAVAAYVDPANVYSLISTQTFTQANDQAWFDALLYYQKEQSALGIITLQQFYQIQAGATLTTKSRYSSMLVYWR